MYPLNLSAIHSSPLPVRKEILLPCLAFLIIALGCCWIPDVRSWLQHTFSQINTSSLTVQHTLLWIALPFGGVTALIAFTVVFIKTYHKLKEGEFVAPSHSPSIHGPFEADVEQTGWEMIKARVSLWNRDCFNRSKPSSLWVTSIQRVLPQSKKGWIILAAAIALFIATVTIVALGAPPFHEWLNQSIPLKTGLIGGTVGTFFSLIVATTLGLLIKKMVHSPRQQPIAAVYLR